MSQKSIKFEIVTPEKVVLKEVVTQINVPTVQGDITVLPDHIPLVATLQPGVVEIKKIDGTFDIMSLSGGFLEILRDKVVILADFAERAEEIDLDKTEEAIKRAENIKKDIRSFDKERFANISAKLSSELAKSKAVKRWKKIKNI